MTTVTFKDALQVTIGLDPVPASRPRVTKWGTYYTATYKKWKEAAAKFFEKPEQVLTGPLAVELEVICKRPKKPTSEIPVGDVDNYAKAALDAVNDAQLWEDDKQVTQLLVTKRYAEPGEAPRTIIQIRSLPCKPNAKSTAS